MMKARTFLSAVSRKGRETLRCVLAGRRRGMALPVPGRFQPYNHTLPNRYPWLFQFARDFFADSGELALMSFGCSKGDEVFALQEYFPTATIRGIDIDPSNIECCVERSSAQRSVRLSFAAAATTEAEAAESYDAIFCLAVLCHGDLSTYGARRCDPLLRFEDFEATAADFARCLKPGGLLLLHTTNFRFSDTSLYEQFVAVLEAEPDRMAGDVLFDRHNQLMEGECYRAVAFRKRPAGHAPAPVPAPAPAPAPAAGS